MADNLLRPMLTKLLASKGEKKFFFAYGAGKRKDGKGDGELAVRRKRFKKQEVGGELVESKQVFEGICWVGKGEADAETIYFQAKGKKLSPMIVAKMALTAKRTAGRQYDFQLPSPDEEARAGNLEDQTDANGAPGEELDVPEPLIVDAAGVVPPPPPDGAVAFKARLQALMPRVLEARKSNPAIAGDLQRRLTEATALAGQKDFVQAGALLNRVEQLLEDMTAAASSGAAVVQRFNALTSSLKAALAAKGPDLARIQALAAAVGGLLKNKDYAQASKVLDELAPLLAAGATPEDDAQPALAEAEADRAPVSNVVLTQARLAWDAARTKIQVDLQKLEQAILDAAAGQSEYDPDAVAIGARRLHGILDELDARLIDKLDEALNAQVPDERQRRQQEAARLVKRHLGFVNGDPLMALVDDNGFAPVAVRKTAATALTTLASKL
ncbi:MAG: hypothetical protein L0Y71_21135 [Gemmataceae bacterium]|nr:hypothetical protein [Gemmataceae bacterium]